MGAGVGPGEAAHALGRRQVGGGWRQLGLHALARLRTDAPRPRQGARRPHRLLPIKLTHTALFIKKV